VTPSGQSLASADISAHERQGGYARPVAVVKALEA
jgi:hypothetical protein